MTKAKTAPLSLPEVVAKSNTGVGWATAAGERSVKLFPVLREELAGWKAASADTDPDDFVFATSRGSRPDEHNVRNRVVKRAAKRASERLVKSGRNPLPDGLRPHDLRHSFASLLFLLNTPLPEVLAQVGHADPGVTLGVYAHVMRRDEGDREALTALVGGSDLRMPVEWEGISPHLAPDEDRRD